MRLGFHSSDIREGLGRRRVLPGCWGAAMERKEGKRRWPKRWQTRRSTIWLGPVFDPRFGSLGFWPFRVLVQKNRTSHRVMPPISGVI